MKAFFPISVTTRLFSSDRMKQALPYLEPQYKEFIFLIADRLQMYNDAISIRKAEIDIYRSWAHRPSSLFTQRAKWLKKVLHECGIDESRVMILSIDDIADGEAFLTFRKLLVFYNLNHDFHEAIEGEAHDATDRKASYIDYELVRRMSRIYVLEEIALNIRIRSRFNVYDEYYLGPQMKIFPDIYHGRFSWFLKEAGIASEYRLSSARFFYYDENVRWKEYGT